MGKYAKTIILNYTSQLIFSHNICDRIWENPTFSIFHQNWDFAIFNVWITSLLSVSIYNTTVSELQHFVMQPLVLPILRAVNLHVLIFKIECYSKCWVFADPVTYCHNCLIIHSNSSTTYIHVDYRCSASLLICI